MSLNRKQETPATVPIVYLTVLIGGSLPGCSEVSPLFFLCAPFSYPPAGSKNRGCNITCFTHRENPLKQTRGSRLYKQH